MSLGAADVELIDRALASARDTRLLKVDSGIRHQTPEIFAQQFGTARAIVIADKNTFAAAGRDVSDAFRRHGLPCSEPFVFHDSDLYAEERYVEQLQQALAGCDAIPVAVGSGTINDLTKLVAHRLGRRYMAVATAASMDGYTAYGASITVGGLKQTFDCPAPLAVAADTEVIAAAPPSLNASGYADLMAKTTAGADWIVADTLGVEAIDGPAWETVQGRLREWLDNPVGVFRGDLQAVRRLTIGLMMGGFAMQRTQSSRPASGAEHQFSHLWDMQHHTHHGRAPSHGFKVGIGTLASVALYEQLLSMPVEQIDVEECCRGWADEAAFRAEIATTLDSAELRECGVRETVAKYVPGPALKSQLLRLRNEWPGLRDRLARQLPSLGVLSQKLRDAGCPHRPEQIGIGLPRLRASYKQAYFIRRRFTVLDLACRTGLLHECLERIFEPGGPWAA